MGLIAFAVGLTFACSSFSGDDAPPATSADAADQDVGLALDAAFADTSIADAAPARCSGFDVDAASQPPSNVCGGATKNLAGDPQNCGWCGHVCLDSPVCMNGVCQPFKLVTGSGGTELVRVDDSDVYWVDETRNPNAVFRSSTAAAVDEANAAMLAEVDASEPVNSMAYTTAIDDRIFVHTYLNLYEAPLDGGPLALFSTISPGYGRSPLVVSGSELLQASPTGTGTFFDFAKADGGLVSQQNGIGGAFDLVVTPDGRYAFVIGRTAVDAGVVDGSAVTRAALYRYTIATHDMTFLTAVDAPTSPDTVLTADNELVYFPDATGTIFQLPVDAVGSVMPTMLSHGDGGRIRYLTNDAGRLYWLSSTDAPNYFQYDLFGVDKCGGAARKYVRHDDGTLFVPFGFKNRGAYLYWASSGTIYRIAK